MKNLSVTEKMLIILLGAVIVFYLYYSFYLNPMLKKKSTSMAYIKKYEEDIISSKNIEKENEKLKSQIADLTAKSDAEDKLIPKSERQPEYIKDIKADADKNDVKIVSLKFENAKEVSADNKNSSDKKSGENTGSSDKKSGSVTQKEDSSVNSVYTVPLSINITGDYKNIVSFISEAENGNRFVNVSSVDIYENDNIVSADININYYYSNVLTKKDIKYDFNSGTYGKDDLFK